MQYQSMAAQDYFKPASLKLFHCLIGSGSLMQWWYICLCYVKHSKWTADFVGCYNKETAPIKDFILHLYSYYYMVSLPSTDSVYSFILLWISLAYPEQSVCCLLVMWCRSWWCSESLGQRSTSVRVLLLLGRLSGGGEQEGCDCPGLESPGNSELCWSISRAE